MRGTIQVTRASKNTHDDKSFSRIRVSRSPVAGKVQSLPKIDKSFPLKREIYPWLGLDSTQSGTGYLEMHKKKQVAKPPNFFLSKKKVSLPEVVQVKNDVFQTPRFGEQDPSCPDFLKHAIETKSTTCQSRELHFSSSQAANPAIQNKNTLNLTFADKVEQSFSDLLPTRQKDTQGDDWKIDLARRRVLLPSIDNLRARKRAKVAHDEKFSYSLEVRPQSDGKPVANFHARRIQVFEATSTGKKIKVLSPFVSAGETEKSSQGLNKKNLSNIELPRKSYHELHNLLKSSPTFGCINAAQTREASTDNAEKSGQSLLLMDFLKKARQSLNPSSLLELS